LRRSFRKPNPKNDTREGAIRWCETRSININDAIYKLTNRCNETPIKTLFPSSIRNAEVIAKECPVEMGGPANLDLLFWSSEYLAAEKVIETGVAYGWSSLAILLSIKNRKNSCLVSTDMPYPNKNNDKYVGCVVPLELRCRWQILRYADREGLPKALSFFKTIDMCHYDSDKSYEGRMWAYPLLWKALRPGGFFISDDIGDNTAFRDFSELISYEPIVIKSDDKYIGVIIKQPDA
jgi:predicted O-methyltransferase YrrM